MSAGDRIRAGQAPPAPFSRASGRAAYPHRVTLDLDDDRYDWLRAQAYEARVPAAALVRAALDQLADDPSRLGEVVVAARDEFPAPTPPARRPRTERAARNQG